MRQRPGHLVKARAGRSIHRLGAGTSVHRRRLAVVLPYPDLGRHCLTVARVFGERCLAEVDYAYLWDDGIHVKFRLEQNQVWLLVMIGVRLMAAKNSWPSSRQVAGEFAVMGRLAARLQTRGMRAPVRAVGEGAVGFRKAVRDDVPRHQRAAVLVAQDRHNVLAALPNRPIRAPRKHWPRSTTPNTNSRQRKPQRRSRPTTGRSGRKPPPRSPIISMCCSPSTTSRLGAKGCICAPRTRSSKADQDFGQLCVFSASSTSPDSSGYQGWGHDLAIALAAGWGLLGRLRAAGPRGRQVRGSGLIGVLLTRAAARGPDHHRRTVPLIGRPIGPCV